MTDFKNAAELLELCRQHEWQISHVMKQRECDLGEVTMDQTLARMARVLEIMKELAEDGMTMVVVTHEMGFARSVATRVLFMDEGVIAEQNEPGEFVANPQHPRLREFLSKVL